VQCGSVTRASVESLSPPETVVDALLTDSPNQLFDLSFPLMRDEGHLDVDTPIGASRLMRFVDKALERVRKMPSPHSFLDNTSASGLFMGNVMHIGRTMAEEPHSSAQSIRTKVIREFVMCLFEYSDLVCSEEYHFVYVKCMTSV
jgi:hypothetical protein